MAGYSVKGIALTNIELRILLLVAGVMDFDSRGHIVRTICDVEVINIQERDLRPYTIAPATTSSL